MDAVDPNDPEACLREVNGSPAFPTLAHDGMALRDYFAAKALAAYVGGCIAAGVSWSPREVVRYSFDLADLMLKERQK